MTDTGGTERPAFDPRHDARFQRGYRPGHDDGPAPVRRTRAAAPSAAAAPPAAAAAPVTPRAEADPVAANGLIDDLGSIDDDLDALAFDADGFQDELEPSRWNPFIALLWLLAPVLILPAVAVQYLSATASYSNVAYDGNGAMPLSMVISQLSYAVSPSLLTAGLVIVAGLLFWHAWAWRARRVAPRR